ncbi:MAG: PAS domain S-box protein [Crocinitomicaceae bacterium]|nr:PAS domain S-box protein [Crocinitomicaceae bacterium]
MSKSNSYQTVSKQGLQKMDITPEEKIVLLEKRIAELEKNHALDEEDSMKYRSLFEMSDDALLVIENNTFVDCNEAVVKMLGYKTREELLNTHPSELSPEKQPDGRFSYEKAQEMIDLAIKNGSHHFEWIHTRANGENFPVEVWLSKVEYKDKVLINTIWRDLTQKKKAEQTILKNIEEKEILLKEIHHRVKNNLQIIISLLNLQANSTNDSKVRTLLYQSKSRIEAMCKVHQMLYGSSNLSSINYADYLKELLRELFINTVHDTKSISLEIKSENLFLNINTAIPLGLMINEFVTNSLKYAFPDQKGKIVIEFSPLASKRYLLNYADNGVGYPAEKNFDNTSTLGFQLISSLTEQLNGKLERDLTVKGTRYSLEFDLL